MFFKKKNESNEQIETIEPQSIVIHYTSAAIFLYHFKGEGIYADCGTVTFVDNNGNRIEIGGSFTILELDEESEISSIIHKFKLKEFNVPLIEIEVGEY